MSEWYLCSNCSVAELFPEKSSVGGGMNRSSGGGGGGEVF